MKTMKIFASTLLISAALSTPAYAACTRADLTGTWRLFTVFDSVARCTLVMPSVGATVGASSTCWLPDVASVTLRGTINVLSDCRVYGSITIGTRRRLVEAYISKGKDSISGIAWQSGNPYSGNQFSGVKQ